MNRELLDQELSKIEKPAGIANPKDFRYEVVKFCLRARARNKGHNPNWTVLREDPRGHREAACSARWRSLLPVISFEHQEGQRGGEEARRVRRAHGRRAATPNRQVRRLVEWYMRVKKAG